MPKRPHKKGMTRGQYIFIAIIGAMVAGIVTIVYTFAQNVSETIKFGAIDSTHVHATMLVMINGKEAIDFSQEKYQVRSPYIHFEYGNGYLVHMHATNVYIGYLFKSLNMRFDDQCLTLDNGTSYCNDANNTLKFYVNGKRNDEYGNYVFKDGDKLLISYGPEDPEEIDRELRMLDDILKK